MQNVNYNTSRDSVKWKQWVRILSPSWGMRSEAPRISLRACFAKMNGSLRDGLCTFWDSFIMNAMDIASRECQYGNANMPVCTLGRRSIDVEGVCVVGRQVRVSKIHFIAPVLIPNGSTLALPVELFLT